MLKIKCPRSQWASKALELGIYLPEKLEDKGNGKRCRTVGKEEEKEKDAKYSIKNEDGVFMLTLHNYRNSQEPVVLIDDSQAQGKKAHKGNTDIDPAEEAEKQAAEEMRLAEFNAMYRAFEPATNNNAYLQRKGVPCVPGLKQDKSDLVMPFFDEKGNVTGLQHITPEGSKQFSVGSHWGLFTIHGLPDTLSQYVLICEGVATGISLWYSTFATVIVTGCAGNMSAGAKYAKVRFPGFPVICCADNDNKGDKNTGLEAAKRASLAHGCFLAVPPAADGEKMDFNDLYLKFGREKVAEVVADALKQGSVKIPEKFTLSSEGLFVEVVKGKFSNFEQISKSPLELVALAKPLDRGNAWGRFMRWKDPDGEWQNCLLPLDVIASDPKYVSSQIGKSYITNWGKYRNVINEYLDAIETDRRIELSDHCGWVKEGVYVTPYRSFGFSKFPVQSNVVADMAEYTPKGSLDEFKELTRLAQGNPIYIIALCTAFAAPLLGLASQESGGFHFVGPSSCGKTTALVMATAVYRAPKFIGTWNTTDNALEFTANKYNDGLLTIDEISQVNPKDLRKIVYSLANGAGKKRCTATKNGVQEAKQRHWRLSYLSTGEEDIEQVLMKAGIRPQAGQTVRLASIPLEEDHIHNLHGYETKTDFLSAVRTLSDRSYGVAGERYLEYLTAFAAPLRENISKVIAKYVKVLCKPYRTDGKQIDNQVERVAARFALCIIGGCLASAWGIIDISQAEIFQSLTQTFATWIEYRGGTQSSETLEVVNGTRALLKEYAANFIPDIDCTITDYSDVRKKTMTPPRGGIAGYIVTDLTAQGHYVDRDFFKNTLCPELNKTPGVVKKILEKAGYLIRGSKDHLGTKYTPKWLYGNWTSKSESGPDANEHRSSPDRYYRIYYPEMFLTPESSAEEATESKPKSC